MRLRDERLSIGTALLGHRAASDASRLLPLCKALRPLRLNLRIADYRDRKMRLGCEWAGFACSPADRELRSGDRQAAARVDPEALNQSTIEMILKRHPRIPGCNSTA